MSSDPLPRPAVVTDPWLGQAVREDLSAALPPHFAAFYLTYHRSYLRYAHIQLGTRAEAESVVEDFFVHLASRWREVLTQPSVSADAWAAFKEEVAQRLAHRGRGIALVETAAFAALRKHSRATLAALESELGLYAVIARLTERHYDVIVLHHVLGIPQQEVAQLMGVSYGTVRSHLRSARRRLARELGYSWYTESEDT